MRITRWTRTLVAVVVTTLVVLWLPAPAHADGGAACGSYGDCGVFDFDAGNPGSGGSSGGSDSDEIDEVPALPECGAYEGARTDVPIDVPNPEDWVQISCLEGSLTLLLWVEGQANPERIARTLVARIQLKPIHIGLVPRGADAMTVVGMPVWLWVDEPSATTWGPATISAGGVSLTAKVQSVTWEMGDGTTLTCGKGTEWQRGMGGDPSPTCGHTYEEQGTYTIRARSHWVASWSGYGQSGTIPVTLSTTRQLDVGEIQVIVTGG